MQKAYLGYSDDETTRPSPSTDHPGAPAVRRTIRGAAMSVPILEVVDLHAAYGRIEVLRGVDLQRARRAR